MAKQSLAMMVFTAMVSEGYAVRVGKKAEVAQFKQAVLDKINGAVANSSQAKDENAKIALEALRSVVEDQESLNHEQKNLLKNLFKGDDGDDETLKKYIAELDTPPAPAATDHEDTPKRKLINLINEKAKFEGNQQAKKNQFTALAKVLEEDGGLSLDQHNLLASLHDDSNGQDVNDLIANLPNNILQDSRQDVDGHAARQAEPQGHGQPVTEQRNIQVSEEISDSRAQQGYENASPQDKLKMLINSQLNLRGEYALPVERRQAVKKLLFAVEKGSMTAPQKDTLKQLFPHTDSGDVFVESIHALIDEFELAIDPMDYKKLEEEVDNLKDQIKDLKDGSFYDKWVKVLENSENAKTELVVLSSENRSFRQTNADLTAQKEKLTIDLDLSRKDHVALEKSKALEFETLSKQHEALIKGKDSAHAGELKQATSEAKRLASVEQQKLTTEHGKAMQHALKQQGALKELHNQAMTAQKKLFEEEVKKNKLAADEEFQAKLAEADKQNAVALASQAEQAAKALAQKVKELEAQLVGYEDFKKKVQTSTAASSQSTHSSPQ